ncbi:hypothetical protein AXG93_154s1340 [Marchantia polymorpha subsp. ruderalis]|uniref:glycerophosphodiester phosphodiesterase n=1 Tax=Marchantia polymorpha subsp. ruderalis TaxID=1480154 RepID=A0A176VIF5_MARPO|nr:hypothetical protein AXG93_154s1340 [Marchantia polymorpha subsp. ruderalis]
MASSTGCRKCLLAALVIALLSPSLQEAQAIRSSTKFSPSRNVRNAKRKGLQTERPYNVAHRGANGELPEATAQAYVRAIEIGADFLETDILATKDGVLICMHDMVFNDTSNIKDHPEFADRVRTYDVQGANVTGWFTVDFTLDEIKTLKARQRFDDRDHSYDGRQFDFHDPVVYDQFDIITFEEFIAVALNSPRIVGIYPEIKNPVFINEHVKWAGGKKFEDIFVEILLKYDYSGAYLSKGWMKQPLFIQSFAPSSLVYVSNLTDSPLIFLIDDVNMPTQDTNQTFAEITSDSYLDYISQYVVGIGPWKDNIVPPDARNYLTLPTDLVDKAHARNLQVSIVSQSLSWA